MRLTSSLLIALALAACDKPEVLVICHNSNCAEPTDPENDDSLGALSESFKVEVGGKPAIDGVEVDLFWRGTDDTCIFAHDLVNNPTRTELATEAAAKVAEHFAEAGPITYGGGPFQMFVELKDYVDADKTMLHTEAQRIAHAQCAWDFYKTVTDAAVANGRDIDFFFGSFGPEMLREVIRQTPPGIPFPPRYESYYGVPKPLDPETRPLSDYKGIPITLIEFHSQWITDDEYEAIVDTNIELAFFMFSATEEHFAAIEQYEPKMVNTSEATLVRRWLQR